MLDFVHVINLQIIITIIIIIKYAMLEQIQLL